jgi:FtsZ-binding cell division protein ZapB
MPSTETSTPSTSSQVFSRLDHETLCKKLIESVEMIKELHQGNKTLRENVQAI